ncbi:MAG: hypothetical protein AAF138_08260 [Planctomycetota bacterium]
MSPPRELLLLHWSPVRLSAVGVTLARGAVKVRGSLVRPTPADLDMADTSALGSWIQSELDDAGLRFKKAVVVLSRSAIAIQRMPMHEGLDERERLAAAELQFKRLGPMDPEGAAIAVRSAPGVVAGSQRAPESVAAALPANTLQLVREVIERAGRRLVGVSLRADGLAKIAPDGLSMVAMASGPRVELALVAGGAMVFGREGEIALGEGRASSLAVEIRRTIMAARSEGWTLDHPSPLFLDAEEDGASASQVGETLLEDVIALEPPEELNDFPAHEAASLAPLVGLARAYASDSAFDLLKRPARRAMPRRRRLLYLSAGAAAVLGTGLWIVHDRALSEYRDELATQRGRTSSLQAEYVDLLTVDARVRHLDRWLEVEPDWPGYIVWLREQLPPRDRLLLTSVRASVEGEPAFEPKRRRKYTDGVFTSPREVVLTIDGSASDRAAIAEFRARLLATPGVRVEPRGADEPDRFSLRVLTGAAVPAPATAVNDGDQDGGADG